jgi:dihydroorotate dehydrogenase (fumarate)
MNTSTYYMGLQLKNPLVLGSCGLSGNVDRIENFANNGIGAVVLKSLFEEQITPGQRLLGEQDEMYHWFSEASEMVTQLAEKGGMEAYTNFIKTTKSRVDIPIIASINCSSQAAWANYAHYIEMAGADALELNMHIQTMSPKESKDIEDMYVYIIHQVKSRVKIPIAVKIGNYFTNLAAFIERLSKTGVQALVLFNRFYQPDIDTDKIRISHNLYSSPSEINQSLRWIALMSGNVKCDLAASTGIHDADGVVKQLLAGATITQLVSAYYMHGASYTQHILQGLKVWMHQHEYSSINEFRGLLARNESDLAAFERVQFIKKSTGIS